MSSFVAVRGAVTGSSLSKLGAALSVRVILRPITPRGCLVYDWDDGWVEDLAEEHVVVQRLGLSRYWLDFPSEHTDVVLSWIEEEGLCLLCQPDSPDPASGKTVIEALGVLPFSFVVGFFVEGTVDQEDRRNVRDVFGYRMAYMKFDEENATLVLSSCEDWRKIREWFEEKGYVAFERLGGG